MKTKQKTKKRKMPTATEKNKATAGKTLEATGGLPEDSSSTLVSAPAAGAAAASLDSNSKKKKASDRRKAKRKKKKMLSRKEREDKQSMDQGDLVGTESTGFVPFADPWYMNASISAAAADGNFASAAWPLAAFARRSARAPCAPQNRLFSGVSSVPSRSRKKACDHESISKSKSMQSWSSCLSTVRFSGATQSAPGVW